MPHIIGGALVALLGVWGIFGWFECFGDFLRGAVPLFLLIGGLIALNTGLKLRLNKGKR